MLVMPSNKANSLRGFRLAAAALCVALSGCTMALQNEARLGRLTTSDLKPTKATLVFGLDASRGPIGVALRRFDPPPLVADADGKCSEASASTPKGSTGKTYFVFDVPPGRYAMQNHEALVFVVPAGKQVYIGDFVGTPEGQALITEMHTWNPSTTFTSDLATAKAALGPRADRLELAETGPPRASNVVSVFVCTP
jgi:hypothetical protein